MVFGVVILSIFIQGITMPFLLKVLNISQNTEKLLEYETLKTKISLIQKIINELSELKAKLFISEKNYQDLINEYRNKLNTLIEKLNSMQVDLSGNIKEEEKIRIKRELLMKEKEHLINMYHSGNISHKVYKKLIEEIDSEIFEVENKL